MSSCETCNLPVEEIPYAVLECESEQPSKTVRCLSIALIISILCLAGSNMAWLYAWANIIKNT